MPTARPISRPETTKIALAMAKSCFGAGRPEPAPPLRVTPPWYGVADRRRGQPAVCLRRCGEGLLRWAAAWQYRRAMKVVIAGGHGKIALHLERLLAERGDHSTGLIRDAAQEADVIAAGAHPVVVDLENTTPAALSEHLAGADAVVFAAGAGPGSSAERKDSVDRAAAALLADAATLAGIRRYVLISAIGSDAGPQPDHDPVFAAYITAKKAADDDLRGRDLDWTVVRPGALTDASGSGHVTLSSRVGRGSVPREDVAAVLVAVLDEPRTAGLSLDVVSGRHPIADAVAETLEASPDDSPAGTES